MMMTIWTQHLKKRDDDDDDSIIDDTSDLDDDDDDMAEIKEHVEVDLDNKD